MSQEKLQVRRLGSTEEIHLATEKRAKENDCPGELDHISFFAVDKNGFFANQLGDQTIGCIFVLRHTEDLAFIGYYYVDEQYRGKGYGQQMWKKALELASLPENCNIGLVSSTKKQHIYKRIGFKPCWEVLYLNLVPSEALAILSHKHRSSEVKVLPASQAKFEDVLKYDAQVYGFSRERFLEKWLSAPNCHAFVALDKEERVTGYTVVRTTLRQHTWRIGSLFADDSTTATGLYHAVFGTVVTVHRSGNVYVEVPHGGEVNRQAMELVLNISGKPDGNYVCMYTKGVPPGMMVDKIFAHTATEIY